MARQLMPMAGDTCRRFLELALAAAHDDKPFAFTQASALASEAAKYAALAAKIYPEEEEEEI